MHPRSSLRCCAAILAFFVVSGPAAHPAAGQFDDAMDLQVAAKAANGDPALHTDHDGGLCTINWICTGTLAQITWPRDGASCWADAPTPMPLVAILHGYGFDHTDYDYLKTHLARNGMFVASFDVVSATENAAGHQAAASQVADYLQSECFQSTLLDLFPGQGVNLHRTGLVGHSRGGETTRFLASELTADPNFTTQAVVAMAPTLQSTMSLYGTQTSAYLLLYGGEDVDVPPSHAFAAHDLAGWNEISTPTVWDLDRVMKFFPWGRHSGFIDTVGGVASLTTQQDMTAGYVNAFLRAWLLGDWQFYDAYVRGDAKPAHPGYAVWSQLSSSVARRVIDNFQDLNLTPSTMGGAVATFGMTSAQVLDASTIATTPHAGRMLRVKPGQNNAYVEWTIPPNQADNHTFRHLSLRIGQITGSGPISARILIRNGGLFSSVLLDDLGGIPEPTPMCLDGNPVQGCFDYDDLGFLRTIRIPLSSFWAVNQVEKVYLQFLSGAVGDEILVDNLEFSELAGGGP